MLLGRKSRSIRVLTSVRSLALSLSLGAFVLVSAPRPVVAQTQEDLERARQQFRQGLSLEAAGNWAAALAKFQEVGKVKLTPQVRFHAARCNEQLGRLNEALGEYRLAEYEAGQQGLKEAAEISQARQALESRVPKLVIKRGEGAEAARVELDGVELGEAQIGQPVSVDPGPHTIVAKLGGDRQVQESASVKESETAEVVLKAPAVAETKPEGPHEGNSTVPPEPEKKHASAVPWIVGGVGVAGLAASGIFFGLREGAKSDLEKGCDGNTCPASLKDKQNQGELYTTLAWVSLGVGVAGVGVATYLFLSGAGSSHEVRASLPVDVAVLPGGGFVTVRGNL